MTQTEEIAQLNKQLGEKKPRKKREAQHNHGRRREAPTRIVEHWIGSCPECASRLGGVSVARRRQVIEIAPPPPVEVTEHVIYHGWCSQCKKWREAPLDVSAQVMGQGRVAREDHQPDCVPTYRDACAGAAGASLSGYLTWSQDQRGRNRRGIASAQRRDGANLGNAQSRHPSQPGGAS